MLQLAPLISARPKKFIQIGDSGEDVHQLQLKLLALGYKLKGTGYFGGATDTAVEDFQRSQHLSDDGEVGSITAKSLDSLAAHLGASPISPVQAHPLAGRPLWLVEALSRIGTKEKPGAGDNPVIIEWAKELGGEVAQDYTHDSIPWCALFVDSCLHRVGLKSPNTLWALDYEDYGVKLAGPAVGALAPMIRSGGGHVVIIVGRDRAGNFVCVGGNQSDAVNIRAFPRSRLTNFRWPTGVSLPSAIGDDALPLIRADGGLSLKEA